MITKSEIRCLVDNNPVTSTIFSKSEDELIKNHADRYGTKCLLKRSCIHGLVNPQILEVLSKTKNIQIFENKTLTATIDLLWNEKFFN